jgi:hypothetical protein
VSSPLLLFLLLQACQTQSQVQQRVCCQRQQQQRVCCLWQGTACCQVRRPMLLLLLPAGLLRLLHWSQRQTRTLMVLMHLPLLWR